jgi:hypothetical protein
MNRTQTINISHKHKYFTWTPGRTGSHTFTNIITQLGFESSEINLETNQIVSHNPKPKHNHTFILFEGHEQYKFIVSVRNPYSMVISQVCAAIVEDPNVIRMRTENMMQNPYKDCSVTFHDRIPDYAIRIENLYEDWVKIPFVKNHELNLSGELKKLTETKLNSHPNSEGDYWKKYYDQSLADLVFYNHPNTFELFGYDRNSWKL